MQSAPAVPVIAAIVVTFSLGDSSVVQSMQLCGEPSTTYYNTLFK